MGDGNGGAVRWSVRVLGDFELRIDDRPLPVHDVGSRKERQLLKLLIVERGGHVGVDRIVEALWDEPPRRSERQVATLVSRLRGVLGRDAIHGGPAAYRVVLGEAGSVDLEDAARLVGEAERRLGDDETTLARVAAERALELLGRGAPLADEPDREWVDAARREGAALLRRARVVLWRSALAGGDSHAAASAADRALDADPLDEDAARALMRAHAAAGEPARALAAYGRLSATLAQELDLEPARETEELRARIVAHDSSAPDGGPAAADPPAGRVPRRLTTRVADRSQPREAVDPAFVGRDRELESIAAAWAEAGGRRGGMVLLVGEAGIGKSTLARRALATARATGGLVLEARCYRAEHSLFLQPIADALRPLVVRTGAATLRELVGDGGAGLARLVPELAAVLELPAAPPSTPELEHRRAIGAVAGFIRALAVRRPLLLFLDDLHAAGEATLEFLHFLLRRDPAERLLVLGTVRDEEGDTVRRLLAEVASEVEVGPLPPRAVRQLAAAMGCADVDDELLRRAAGHPLFAVEMLRTIRQVASAPEGAEPQIPQSLRTAVLRRAADAGRDVHDLLSAASVLGLRFEPATLADLTGGTLEATVRALGAAHRARLVSVTEREYTFANDLIHEILYAATPLPVRIARHRVAAGLSADRPESAARHSHAAGDWGAAAKAWLEAAEAAMAAFANRDAERLIESGLEAARLGAARELEVRLLLARGAVRERAARYPEAFDDNLAARDAARDLGHRPLEMRALVEMGGDPSVALGRRPAACVAYLQEALAIADDLGDEAAAVGILRRLAILETNRLRGTEARAYAGDALARARALGDTGVLATALDGCKTVAAYLGDVAVLTDVVEELEPLLVREGRLWLLQWTVFESALAPFARGEWEAALGGVERALELSRRSGYHAYTGMFLAQRAWIESARGRLGAALDVARRAREAADASGHPWWIGFSSAVLGGVLLSVGDAREAITVLEEGLAAAERDGAELYTLHLLGPLAEGYALLGRREAALAAATRTEEPAMREGPPFLHAARGPIGAARARILLGDPGGARASLERVHAAAMTGGWVEPAAQAALALGEAALAGGAADDARRELTRALELARRTGMTGVEFDALTALSTLDPACEADAARVGEALRASLGDPVLARSFDARAARRRSGWGAPSA